MESDSRLDPLELSNRWLIAAVLVVGACSSALRPLQHVHAGDITITAPNGNNIAHFGANRNGDGKIVMYDRNGAPLILIVADKDYDAVRFVDSNLQFSGSIVGRDVTETVEPAERMKGK